MRTDLWQVVRYNVAGVIATAVHLAVMWTAALVLGWSLLAANVVAFLVANTASYFLQSRWTFRLRPQTRRRWYGASLITLALAGVMGRAADVFMPSSRFAWLLVVIPIAFTSYLLMRFWVFTRDQATASATDHEA